MVLAAPCSSVTFFMSHRKIGATRSGAVKLEMFNRSGSDITGVSCFFSNLNCHA